MMIVDLIFYVFAFLVIFSGVQVISNQNPVVSVLYLIFAFFNATGLFVLLGAEFLAMLLVIVYVGAVAVLFLFVVMMLDIKQAKLKQGFLKHAPLGISLGVLLLAEIIFVYFNWGDIENKSLQALNDKAEMATTTNTHALGNILYTDHIVAFQTAGFILLLAMIGAILLSLHHQKGVKRQNINQQMQRTPKDTLAIVKNVPKRGGV